MKKSNVINFLSRIKDCDEVAEIYIENGIKKDYINVRYYDKDGVFRKKDEIYEKEK